MNTFKPTQQQLRRAWSYYNAVLFNGALKVMPKFKFNKSEKIYGYYTDGRLGFSTVLCTTVALYIDTLTHEMVHQWQFENMPYNAFMSDENGHGACFKAWRERVLEIYPSEDYDDD